MTHVVREPLTGHDLLWYDAIVLGACAELAVVSPGDWPAGHLERYGRLLLLHSLRQREADLSSDLTARSHELPQVTP